MKNNLILLITFMLVSLTVDARSPAIDPMMSYDINAAYQPELDEVDLTLHEKPVGYNFEYARKAPVRGNDYHLMHPKHFYRHKTPSARAIINSEHPMGFLWFLVACFFMMPFLILKTLLKKRAQNAPVETGASILDFNSASQRKKVTEQIEEKTKWKKTG